MPPKAIKTPQDVNEKAKQPKLTDYALRDQQKANANDSSATAQLAGATGTEGKSQDSKVDEILAIVTTIKTDLDNIRGEMKDCVKRVNEAETRISNAEDEVEILRAKTRAMEAKQKALEEKMLDLESRSRRNNLRLAFLPEGSEGRDPCKFLEKWLPETFGREIYATPFIIERAHKIGPRRVNNEAPRVLIMKFLNYRDKMATVTAARAKGNIHYEEQQVRFYPDLAAEVHQQRKLFDPIREELRKLGLRHGLLHPAKLLVTQDGKTFAFKTPAEAWNFIRKTQNVEDP
ncbi:unnamed protein product [Knipowitschia caucasica]